MIPCIFTINKRNTRISDTEQVRIKPREKRKLNWDDKLTLEFNGKSPCVSELTIERTDNVPTVFLCGNSTVVDQDNEPWGSWGQMIPRFSMKISALPIMPNPEKAPIHSLQPNA